MKVAKIETEKMLISMVETELAKRKSAGLYSGNFKGQSHFFGYGSEFTVMVQMTYEM
jgi:pyrophosphate--fructose-6-phosphate 1-phosphotransferase